MKCWKKDKQKINDFREYLHDLEVKSGLFESLPATETLRHFTIVLTITEYTSRKSPRIHTLQIEMRQNLREVNNSDHTPIAGHAWIEGLYL